VSGRDGHQLGLVRRLWLCRFCLAKAGQGRAVRGKARHGSARLGFMRWNLRDCQVESGAGWRLFWRVWRLWLVFARWMTDTAPPHTPRALQGRRALEAARMRHARCTSGGARRRMSSALRARVPGCAPPYEAHSGFLERAWTAADRTRGRRWADGGGASHARRGKTRLDEGART
jgi:hypothetical protein